MLRRLIISVIIVCGLVLVFGAYTARGQDGGSESQFEPQPIITTATNAVGVGTYVAAEAFGTAAGEDPATQPTHALVLPYAIYPNMNLMSVDDFVQPASLFDEGFTFTWSFVAPDGSSAALLTGETDNVAIFQTDIEGRYALTLTVTDPNGNVGEMTWNVDASTYVGVGGMDGMEIVEDVSCASCHEDEAANWSDTGHATALTRGLDGLKGTHFGPNCVSCHSTGFNNNPAAVNGGFDDVAAANNWTFPATLQEGNWTALTTDQPAVAALGNVQCEACHGPGNLHVQEGSRKDPMIGSGLSYGTCAQCHAEEPYHVYPLQWENSAHAVKNARAFTYPIGEEEQECVRCHTGGGFIDYVNGEAQEDWRVDYQPITCAVCHDPHDAKNNPSQLRVFDTTVLPNGTEVADAGASATCMTCHNVRREGGAEGQVAAALSTGKMSTPHNGNNQAELLNGTGGFTFGATLPSSGHVKALDDTCTSCHMSTTPGMDNNGTPDDKSDDTPLPGHNEVGGHTFAMKTEDVEHIAACQDCHDGETQFDFEARRDYDGDGTTEGVMEEVAGLRELVWAALLEKGVTETDTRPYFAVPAEGADETLYGALWNYYFTERESSAVHNFKYTVSLLQLTYEQLTGSPVPNATIIPPKAVAE